MHLVQFAVFAEFTAGIARGFRCGDGHIRQISEMLADQFQQRVMFKRACARNDDGRRPVMAPHIAHQRVALHGFD